MAEYHVKVNKNGDILAGTQTKTGAWNHNSIVTEEALEAVRDHLILLSVKENKNIGFSWEYPNGKIIMLRLDEKSKEELENKKGE